MTGKPLLQGNIVLEVEHEIIEDRGTDVVNLIGGIANTLEGIVYSNDNQIKEVHFRQILSQRDTYKVRIKKLSNQKIAYLTSSRVEFITDREIEHSS